MTAEKMRNPMGKRKWIDASDEATVWEILIACVFIYLYFPGLLSNPHNAINIL